MKHPTCTLIISAITLFVLGTSFLNAGSKQLKFESTTFPVSASFPFAPVSDSIDSPDHSSSKVYYFVAQEKDTSVSYVVIINALPPEFSSISRAAAHEFMKETFNGRIKSMDATHGVKARVIKSNSKSFSGYPSMYSEILRQTEPNYFGFYRSVFIDRLAITISGTGLNTTGNRLKALRFVDSLGITK